MVWPCCASFRTARNWLAKLMSMTSDGWPSAAARLTSLPSPIRYTRLRLLSVYCMVLSLTSFLPVDCFSIPGIDISTLKWPAFAKIAPSFILAMSLSTITSLHPVVVMNTSPTSAALFILATL